MHSNADAEACITALNGTVIDGKTVTVAHVSVVNLPPFRALTDRPDEDVLELPLRAGTTVSRSTLEVPEATEEVMVEDTAVEDTAAEEATVSRLRSETSDSAG